MKKTVCIFLALFAILAVAKAQKTIKVAAFNYYPAIFMDTDGVVKGFYVDALNELGEKEKLKFIYVFGTWNEGLEHIKSGEVDILTSVAITEERLNYMDYTSTPILTVWSEVYVKPKSEIKGILDLNGKTVAVMKSDFNGIYIKQLTEKLAINCHFIETTDFDEVFKLIADGDVDAGVVNNIFGSPKSIEYQLISSGIVFNPFDIFFTVKKDSNQDLLKLLNTYFNNWKHDGNSVLNTARQKWSHANVGAIEVFPKWLQKAIYSTLFIILALLAFVAFFRYKLRVATEKSVESETRTKNILQTAMDGFWIVDFEARFIEVNEIACKMLGYTLEEMLELKIADIESIETMEQTSKRIQEIIEKGEDRFESKHRCKNGETIDVEISVKKQAKENLFVVFVHNITERKLSEKAIKENNEKYKSIANDLNKAQTMTKVGSWKWYCKDNLLEWSDEMYRIFGIQKDKFTGNLADVIQQSIHPDDRAAVEASNNSVINEGASIPLEYRIVMPNGTIKTVWAEAGEIITDNDSNPSILTGIVQDITERKLAEEAIKESENKYRQLFDLSPVGTLIVGMDKRFIKCNAAFCNFIGYPENELIGKQISEITYPEDIEVGMKEIKQIADGITEAASVEKRYLRKDGQIVWGNVAISIVRDANHKPLFLIPIIQDITQRKQAEIELLAAKEKAEESEENLRFLFENMIQGVVYHKPTGDIIRANEAAASILGLSLDQFYGKTSLDPRWKSIHEDGTEYTGETHPVMETIKTKNPVRNSIMGIFIPEKNGYSWININSIPKFNSENELIQIVVTFEDITEIRNAKEKAEESDKRLKNLVDSTEAIIWEADAQTFKFTFVSKQAERLLGYSTEDWYTDNFWADHLYEEDKEAAINYCVLSTKQMLDHDFEYRFVSKNGRIVWLRDVVNVVAKDQDLHVLRGVMFDITANKLAQEALKESEGKLSALFASMTEMVVLHELEFDKYGQPANYRITDCNAAFTQVTGIKKEDALGKLATELYGTETPPYFDEYKQVAISGKPHKYNTYFAPMDKHFSISVVSPKKNHFATITADITAMQQIQNIISAKNKELENYLYVSSHDLRSPLVNIQGFSQRLQKQINSIDALIQECELEPLVKTNLTQITDKSIPETLNFIFTSVAKMDVLINSLLQISRVGRIKMEIKNIDTNLLITNIINQLNFQLTEISATIKVEKLPHCFGDENTLNQLFANILDNAIKYRNPKVPLLIKIEGKVIYNKVIYSIRDNGVGIAPKYLNKIWDVFYRIDPSIHENGEGIGLSIVKRIVDKHKGKIWVESEEGLGTTFYIELQAKEFEE